MFHVFMTRPPAGSLWICSPCLMPKSHLPDNTLRTCIYHPPYELHLLSNQKKGYVILYNYLLEKPLEPPFFYPFFQGFQFSQVFPMGFRSFHGFPTGFPRLPQASVAASPWICCRKSLTELRRRPDGTSKLKVAARSWGKNHPKTHRSYE